MHRAFRKVWAWAWGIVALGLIMAAVLLTLLRLALPFLGEYRADVERRVEAYLDMPVTIDRLDIEWRGLGPRLRLAGVRIEGPPPAGGELRFRDAYVELALAPRAEGLPFRIDGVALVGGEIDAALDADGQVSLLGFTLDPGALRRGAPDAAARARGAPAALPAGAAAVLERLFGVDRLALLDATLVLHGADGARTEVSDIDLRLRNDGDRHRAAASLSLPAALGERLRVVADLTGPAGDLRAWRGTVYAEGRDLALGAWSALWPQGPPAARGRLDFSVWSDWRAGRVQGALADARATGLVLAARGTGRSVSIREAAGRFAWRRDGTDGWTLDAGGFRLERAGRAWPETGFSVARNDGRWRVGADYVRLEDVVALARVLPQAPAARLAAAAPRGTLRDLRAAGTGPEDFAASGRFEDLGWAARARVPGVTGLDGRARLHAGGGTLELATTDAAVSAPWLFRRRLPVDRLTGTLQVERGPERVRVHTARVVAANADVRAVGRVHVAAGGGTSPWLDLQVDFRDGDLAAASRYLPVGIMPDKVVSWVDAALQEGRIVDGTMLLRGRADAFPYRGHEGVFDVDFRVAGVRLDYAPRWPALEGLEGRVRLHGPGLAIAAESARMRDTRVAPLDVRFADMWTGRLQIRAESTGPFADLVRTLDESPLGGGVGAFFEGAHADGPAGLELALDLPLKALEDTRVRGELRLDGSRLAQPRFELALDELDGRVSFTHESLSFEGLAARLRGRPVTIEARTREGVIRIDGGGRFALPEVIRHLPGTIARHAQGRSDWRIRVRVPLADGTVTISGESGLAGTAITLPEPLAKEAGAGRRLRFELALAGDTGRGTLTYGDGFSAALAVARVDDRVVLDRGTLRFGPGAAALHPRPGVHLEGRLETLDLGAWRAALAGGGGDGAGAGAPAVVGVDLRVARLAYRGRALSGLRVRAERGDGGWRVDLDSDELSGSATAPAPLSSDGRPVTVRLEWLDLERLAAAAAEAPSALAAARPPDPAALPPLDVRVERLLTADGTLRDLVIVTAPVRDGLAIHRLQLGGTGLRIEGQGQWLGGDPQRTSLRLTLRADDLGTGLGAFGYGDAIRDGHGRITVDVAWAAPPWAPDAASVDGHASIDLRDGAIRDVDPGPARILGLFSLNVLRLDFQGLLRRGFPFKRIHGRVDFADGNAYTNGLTVEGPAGRLKMSGRTGLVARDYDQTVTFRPALSESLPIIGALSGGPAAGVAVALIQGLLRNLGADMERASELRYSLTGSWADPRVEKVKTEPAVSDSPRQAPSGGRGR